ncbi:hypothetical protein BCR32DRAFT_215842 [Anaeromyces robustus]|uniref:C3H1-type domain-containing protein n=1 Tax=Anaeromyces robustus TaxID=1754192 RepID=A0A1Y1XM60_9FUNG|nr:hypothetical protein BCR32DRAFT_215842 [Anaeromyces robustus]|eukprot:ORX86822.1 hypothetical protein BCR32DRAFT_215842 [Anaeromyces robustus]
MADNYSMFSALSDVTEDLSELTLKMESQEFKERQKAASIKETSSVHSKHQKNNSNNSSNQNLLTPPWEKKHNRRSLSDGGWNIKKENPSKTEKNSLKVEGSKEDLSRTPSLPSKWSIKRATLYKTELCRAFEETGKCKFGDECIFAHSEEELRPRVDRHPKYKTRICRTFWEQGECPYGKRCCFIHTERDITHPDDFSVFEAQMQQQQYGGNLSTSALLNGSHRRMQSAPEIAHKHRPSNSSDTFMGGIYSMTALDRRSINSEKSSIRSFDTTKESSKLKEEIKITASSDEESEEENVEDKATPDVVLMDETGSITEIIRKPKKTQRFTKYLKVGSHKNNSNTNLDVNLANAKTENVDGKNKSKWFSRNKSQSGSTKEKKSNESSTGRKILSFGRKDKDKDKEKEGQNEKPEKTEKHSKSFFPFVRSHSNNENNETDNAFPVPPADFTIKTTLDVPPPLPSPLVEKSPNNILAADALFGNTEPEAPVDETPKTEETEVETKEKEKEKEKDKKKNKNLTIDANQSTKLEELASPRRFIPNFLLSAITKSNSNSGSNNNNTNN